MKVFEVGLTSVLCFALIASPLVRVLQNDPEMASAIQAGTTRFKEAFMRQQIRMRQMAMEKDRQIDVSLRLSSIRPSGCWPGG